MGNIHQVSVGSFTLFTFGVSMRPVFMDHATPNCENFSSGIVSKFILLAMNYI
jgi:hypothetical protein